MQFDAATVTVMYKDLIILTGHRTPETLLWHLDLAPVHPQAVHHANSAIGSATTAELVTFAHAACSLPNWQCSIQLSTKDIFLPWIDYQYPPKISAPVHSHDQRSPSSNLSEPTQHQAPSAGKTDKAHARTVSQQSKCETPNVMTNQCYTSFMETTGQIYSDQTGRLALQ
jgi:hypothetical protein